MGVQHLHDKYPNALSLSISITDANVHHACKGGETFKAEWAAELPEGEELTIYRQGEWLDMCRGPHMVSTGKLDPNASERQQKLVVWEALRVCAPEVPEGEPEAEGDAPEEGAAAELTDAPEEGAAASQGSHVAAEGSAAARAAGGDAIEALSEREAPGKRDRPSARESRAVRARASRTRGPSPRTRSRGSRVRTTMQSARANNQVRRAILRASGRPTRVFVERKAD